MFRDALFGAALGAHALQGTMDREVRQLWRLQPPLRARSGGRVEPVCNATLSRGPSTPIAACASLGRGLALAFFAASGEPAFGLPDLAAAVRGGELEERSHGPT